MKTLLPYKWTWGWAMMLIVSTTLASTNVPSVAVLDFTNTVITVRDLGPKVTSLITVNLAADLRLITVERALLKKVLDEQVLGLSGMVNSEGAAKVGQLTGAKVLVTGQILKGDDDSLIIIANMVGTETGRLYAEQVQGPSTTLAKMTTELAKKIVKTITEQSTNLLVEIESHEQRITRIVKSVTGPNRPVLSFKVIDPFQGRNRRNSTSENEFSLIFQKAGFTVVDETADRKPEVEITGSIGCEWGPKRGGLSSCRASLSVKAQERGSGKILATDRQTSIGLDVGKHASAKAAFLEVTDQIAARLVPCLSK